MKAIRVFQVLVVMVTGAATGFGVCAGCSAVSERAAERDAAGRGSASAAARPMPVPVPVIMSASAIATAPVVAPPAKPVAKDRALATQSGASPSTLRVARLVVTNGVHEREPLPLSGRLVSDGSAIYAFAELANEGESENVRITFERKGGREKVGDVALPVPAKVGRHRTWAFTRFIRAAGVWEAVLWSESGNELGRTRFEVS